MQGLGFESQTPPKKYISPKKTNQGHFEIKIHS